MVNKMSQIINNLAEYAARELSSKCDDLLENIEALTLTLEILNQQLKQIIKEEQNGKEKPTENDGLTAPSPNKKSRNKKKTTGETAERSQPKNG
jgi:TolA-binding protein